MFAANSDLLLRNIWYHALPSRDLKPGQMRSKTLLNEPILLGRTQRGQAFALRDICPHRAVPLSCGRFDGESVECCYHGWRFGPNGSCLQIPSLMADQTLDLSKFDVRRYDVQEVQGNVWIYMADPNPQQVHPPRFEVPRIPGFPEDAQPQISYTMPFSCFVDHAVVGLMDPAHSPFVHRAWWWRGGNLNPEIKWFDPSPYGFTMRKHRMENMGRGYWLLGGVPDNEICFYLPGIRTEETTTSRHRAVNLTTVTPLTSTTSEVTFQLYWDIPWMGLLKPILPLLIRTFLGQDRDVVIKQQIGLQHESVLRLIKDSDTLARWYYQLKTEYVRSQAENRDFISPVKTQELRWMA
ncbi:Rieske 2Fe-2S domain-containing protein [Leptolyngbya sp. PCC 6406]|uniref:Rieske 2Fe-2S domain-containing protein n=1 Tax=Leptolyngbya sp. PCC 6406 TaxID=1173264 RepID=UPI0002AC7EE3|nr:Rieske 2Fe-2S domain-containing protein [Leptolyngbya sp. PCC 6406]